MDAEQLLNLPALKQALESMRESTVKALEDAEIDGSPASVEWVMETVRQLQAQKKFFRALRAQSEHKKIQTSADARQASRYKSAGIP